MADKYVQKHIVNCYEADTNHLLRPTAMLDLMQEVAGRDASNLGFGYDEMITSKTAWVLSRLHIRFNNYPKWRDEVSIKTWHKGLFKLFYLRDFVLVDKNNNNLIEATTSWLIIDLNTRRLARYAALADNEETCLKEDAIAQPADKITIPLDEEFEFVGKHKAVWSDIDTNGHVNNVKYLVWGLDIVDYTDAETKPLKELFINFDAEVLAGQEVELYRIRKESDEALTYYIQGKVEGKQSFMIKMIF